MHTPALPTDEVETVYPLAADIASVTGRTNLPPAIVEAIDEPAEERSVPRVVMMAGNNITVDARVLKTMAAVANFGVEVYAVGLKGSRDAAEEMVGEVAVIRAKARRTVGAGPFKARKDRLSHGLGDLVSAVAPVFTREEDRRAALNRWELSTRELRADRGADARKALRAGQDAPEPLPPRARLLRAAQWRRLRLARKVIDARSVTLGKGGSGRTSLVRGHGVGEQRERRLRLYRSAPWLAKWERVLPEILDQELAIGPILDRLEPDVIHVHDVFLLGIGIQAARRAALTGRDVKVVYDAHEFIPGLPVVAPQKVAAYAALERQYIREADRVITVSPQLATMLHEEHKLARIPDVVLNAPVADDTELKVIDVRSICELDESVPLLVYGGGVHEARGVHTVVEALQHLPGVHLVVVVKRLSYVTADLVKRAEAIGAGDRLHFAPFVPPELVPRYLATATVGMSPLLHAVNHDVAITNKFCEYLNAGLPIVTSDTPAQAELVNELGLGAVHRAGDPRDCARAVSEVLDDIDQLSRRIRDDAALKERFSWKKQAEVLRGIYDELLEGLPEEAWHEDATLVRRLSVKR